MLINFFFIAWSEISKTSSIQNKLQKGMEKADKRMEWKRFSAEKEKNTLPPDLIQLKKQFLNPYTLNTASEAICAAHMNANCSHTAHAARKRRVSGTHIIVKWPPNDLVNLLIHRYWCHLTDGSSLSFFFLLQTTVLLETTINVNRIKKKNRTVARSKCFINVQFFGVVFGMFLCFFS